MTHRQRPYGRLFPAFAAPLVLAGVLAGPGKAPALAAACTRWSAMQPPDPGTASDDLFGVAVLSPSSAWAVGDDSNGGAFRTLVEHWNGTAWKHVTSPGPGKGSNYLSGVDAVSAASIWAVGGYASQAGGIVPDKTLVLRWNGTAWKQAPAPSPGGTFDQLNSVHAVSATSAWAVGFDAGADGRDKTLVLHWNGTAWKQVPAPSPGTRSSVLTGVTATASNNAWAVGLFSNGHGSQSLALHWNGTSWKQVPVPRPAGGSELQSVSATSTANAWAVGDDSHGNSLTMHWNGRTWARVASPNIVGPGDDNILYSVAATSAGNAWAVGAATAISTGPAFELHWNGHKWSNMVSPNPGATSKLFAVAASSASNAWAVGEFTRDSAGMQHRTLAFHC